MEMKRLRELAGNTKWDRIQSGDIRKTTKQEPIIKK